MPVSGFSLVISVRITCAAVLYEWYSHRVLSWHWYINGVPMSGALQEHQVGKLADCKVHNSIAVYAAMVSLFYSFWVTEAL